MQRQDPHSRLFANRIPSQAQVLPKREVSFADTQMAASPTSSFKPQSEQSQAASGTKSTDTAIEKNTDVFEFDTTPKSLHDVFSSNPSPFDFNFGTSQHLEQKATAPVDQQLQRSKDAAEAHSTSQSTDAVATQTEKQAEEKGKEDKQTEKKPEDVKQTEKKEDELWPFAFDITVYSRLSEPRGLDGFSQPSFSKILTKAGFPERLVKLLEPCRLNFVPKLERSDVILAESVCVLLWEAIVSGSCRFGYVISAGDSLSAFAQRLIAAMRPEDSNFSFGVPFPPGEVR